MTRIARFPPRLITGGSNTIRVQTPVYGEAQWWPMAQAYGWLIGQGAPLVSTGPQMTDASVANPITVGSTRTLHFYARPHIQNTTRMWFLHLLKLDAGAAFGTVNFGGSEDFPWIVPGNTPTGQPITFMFADNSFTPTGAGGDIVVAITNNAGSQIGVYRAGIGCYELPLIELGEFTDPSGDPGCVPDDRSVGGQQPIFAQEYASPGALSPGEIYQLSVRGVHKAMRYAKGQNGAHRGTLFSSYFNGTGIVNTTTTFADVFSTTVPVQHRAPTNATTASMGCFAYASMSVAAATGQVRFTSQRAGATGTATVNSTTIGWVQTTCDVNTEDVSRLDTDGGLRGGVAESVKVELKRLTGTGNITVKGVVFLEAA